jgi:hypothetical protein
MIERLESRQMLSTAPSFYACDTEGRLFTVNAGTGAVHVIGQMPADMFDIAFTSQGVLYGVDGASGTSSLWKINPNTASAIRIGAVGAEVNSLVVSSNGTLYAAGTALYKISASTGRGTEVGHGLGGFSSAGDLAFDTSGNLYLSTLNNNDLVRVNVSTGAATEVGPIGFSLVYGMAFGSNGVLYGMSKTTDDIFSISTSTGHGTYLASFANKGVVGVNGMSTIPPAVSTTAAATTIYGADDEGNLFTVNSATGATHIIGHMSRVMYDIAFDGSGHLYGIDSSDNLFQINASTAAITFIGSIGVSDSINSLTVGPDGDLYAAGKNLYKIDLATKKFYTEGSLGGYDSAGDLAFDKAGQLVMSTTTNQLIEINPTDAHVTLLGNIGFQQVLGLAEAIDGILYGMSNATDQIFSINPITGEGYDPVKFTGVDGVYGATIDPV